MRRIRSNLKGSGFPIVMLAGVNLFVILCMCVMITASRAPRHGIRIKETESHFIMGQYNRDLSHIITITPGVHPRLFLTDREVKGGMDGIDAVLDEWKIARPQNVTVILVCDEAVNIGTVQTLMDKILLRDFNCTFFGSPPSNK